MLGRLIPLLLVTGGLLLTFKIGGKLVGQVGDVARSVLTRSELSNIKKSILGTYGYTSKRPRFYGQEELADFIREEMHSAGRDPAKDMWGSYYLLEIVSGDLYELRSLGPNGYRDKACSGSVGGSGSGKPDALVHQLGVDGKMGGDQVQEVAQDDDICLRFSIPRL